MKNPNLEDGYLRIALELQDAFCTFRIPGEVRQIIDCVIRKTYGYHKQQDWISGSQFMEMTGMSKQNIHRASSKATTHKLIIKSGHFWRLNKNYSEWVSFGKYSKVTTDEKVLKSDYKVVKKESEVVKSDYKKYSKVMDTKDNKNNNTKDRPLEYEKKEKGRNPTSYSKVAHNMGMSIPEWVEEEYEKAYLAGLKNDRSSDTIKTRWSKEMLEMYTTWLSYRIFP